MGYNPLTLRGLKQQTKAVFSLGSDHNGVYLHRNQ